MSSGCGHFELFYNRHDILYKFLNLSYSNSWGSRYIRSPELEPDPNYDSNNISDGDTSEFAGFIIQTPAKDMTFLTVIWINIANLKIIRKASFLDFSKALPCLKNLNTKDLLTEASTSIELESEENSDSSTENPITENILSFEPGEFGERIRAFKNHSLFNCEAIPVDFKVKEIYELIPSGKAFYNKVSSNIDQVKSEVQPVIDLLTSDNRTLEGWEITPPASWTGIRGTVQDIINILGQTTSLLESADQFNKMIEDFEIHTNILMEWI